MHRKRQRSVVGMALLLAIFLVLAPAAAARDQAAPPPDPSPTPPTWMPPKIVKNGICDPGRGETVTFTIFVHNPGDPNASPWPDATWYNVKVVDQIDSSLQIESVTTSKGSYSIVNNTVTVNGGITLPPGEAIDIRIVSRILGAPGGVDNQAYVDFSDPDGNPGKRLFSERVRVNLEDCVPIVPEASTIILLGSAVSGLAGYVGLQIRARRRR